MVEMKLATESEMFYLIKKIYLFVKFIIVTVGQGDPR